MTSLGRLVRDGLAALGDPGKTAKMQAHMKSDMPFMGVSAGPLQQLCKALFAGLRYENAAAWQDDVLALWRHAQFREERYAAIALTGMKAARGFQRLAAIGMYEEIVTSGAWWDYVDRSPHSVYGKCCAMIRRR